MSLMIRAEQIDNSRETPVELVAMIGSIWHKIGVFTITTDNNAILIISKICHPKPCCPFRLIEISLLTKQLDNFFRFPALSDRFFT